MTFTGGNQAIYNSQLLEDNCYNPIFLVQKITTLGLDFYFANQENIDLRYQAKIYNQYLIKIIGQVDDFINQVCVEQKTFWQIQKAVSIAVKSSLKIQEQISKSPYYILTGPLIYSIYAHFQFMSFEESDEIYSILGSITEKYQRRTDGMNEKKEDNLEKMYALLLLSYLNIQQQNLESAHLFIQKMEKEICQKNSPFLEKEIINTILESILVLKFILYICSNKKKEIVCIISGLENLSLNINKVKQQNLSRRVRLTIIMIKSYYYYILRKKNVAKQQLNQISDDELNEMCMIFFNNPNQNCIKALELVYSHYQNNTFRKMIKKLQKLELNQEKIFQEDIDELISMLSEYQGQQYVHGKLIILSQHVVASYLCRLAKKFDQAIYYIKKVGFISSNINLNPPHKVDFYMQYLLLLSNIYYKVYYDSKNKSDVKKNQYIKFEPFSKGGFAEIFKCKIKDKGIIIDKTFLSKRNRNQQDCQFLLLNEAALQISQCHRNIQRVFDVDTQMVIKQREITQKHYQFAKETKNDQIEHQTIAKNIFVGFDPDSTNESDSSQDSANVKKEIVLIQKKQGEDLGNLITHEPISFDTRIGYIFQLIHAFIYLQSLNILHCDVKLSNIVTQKDNKELIKIIDFGISQIQLLERTFYPLGYTRFNDAPVEFKNRDSSKQCSLETDIFLIGKIIETLIVSLKKEDMIIKNTEENEKFLISKQLIELLNEMKINDREMNRLPLDIAFKKFRKEVFIIKMFQAFQQREQINKELFTKFSDKFSQELQSFLHLKYQSRQLKEELINWSIKEFDFSGELSFCNTQSLKEVISQLLNKKDTYFIDCCFEKDIYNFVREIIGSEEVEKILNPSVNELKQKYQEEDDKSKEDIHHSFNAIISEHKQFTQLTDLSTFKNYSQQLCEEISELLYDLKENYPKRQNSLSQSLQEYQSGQIQLQDILQDNSKYYTNNSSPSSYSNRNETQENYQHQNVGILKNTRFKMGQPSNKIENRSQLNSNRFHESNQRWQNKKNEEPK